MAHLGLNLGDGFGTDASGFVKVRAACTIGLETPSTTTQWNVGIEQGAKAMDEGDGTDPGGWARPRCTDANPVVEVCLELAPRQPHGMLRLGRNERQPLAAFATRNPALLDD